MVKVQVRKLRKIERVLQQSPDQQVSLTERDVRSMATSGDGAGVVGYKAGIKTLVPKRLTSDSGADGRFDKRNFVDDPERDEYCCPTGKRATWRMTAVEHGRSERTKSDDRLPYVPRRKQHVPLGVSAANWVHVLSIVTRA